MLRVQLRKLRIQRTVVARVCFREEEAVLTAARTKWVGATMKAVVDEIGWLHQDNGSLAHQYGWVAYKTGSQCWGEWVWSEETSSRQNPLQMLVV